MVQYAFYELNEEIVLSLIHDPEFTAGASKKKTWKLGEKPTQITYLFLTAAEELPSIQNQVSKNKQYKSGKQKS